MRWFLVPQLLILALGPRCSLKKHSNTSQNACITSSTSLGTCHANVPVKNGNSANVTAIDTSGHSYPAIQLKIFNGEKCYIVEAMLDTGASQNFIDPCLAQQLALPISTSATAVTMGNSTMDTASECITPVDLEIGGICTQIKLLVMKNTPRPVILGFPWWEEHKINLDYDHSKVHMTLGESQVAIPFRNSSKNAPPYESLVTMVMNACKGIIPPTCKNGPRSSTRKIWPVFQNMIPLTTPLT
ncbi:retrotransposon-like protein 1 [Entomophthora muscae]|uniref:Retrotransposon-like protein 1 n=1 Tax=Entomophthora muscae TaxID=34485 RepID=A0ACC2S9D6_9FUNG|nr:retrotransposon-like protein 1 [Entomophthora muscae]